MPKLIDLASEISKLFNPQSYFFEYTIDLEKLIYAEKTFNTFELFKAYYNKENFKFDLLKLEKEDDDRFIGFQQSNGALRVFGTLENKDIIYKLLDIVDNQILYAHIHSKLDMILSRSKKYRTWIRRLGEIPSYVKILDNPRSMSERDKYIIDLESMPTHQHLLKTGDRLWFGACAEMYFSKQYYDYIPEDKWIKLSNCKSNEVLENGVRKIILYDNFDEFENPVNRKKQWDFRNELEIDKVASRLKKTKHNKA
ncbi:hypothetical protein [Dokdonia sp. Dokd-P16]|uniref:hypothetical protein n=1 Tax=Dokdonia sp. Dokd-P16 TaxID=2173169 RepID=UPI0013A55362|nr:hypothetical protein [Dokdonia sp. Dokd-P16]